MAEKKTPGDPGHEAAIDTLADVLRALGEFSFDTARTAKKDAAEMFEAWARHLLVGADPPDGPARADGTPSWAALRNSTREHRQDEGEYVVRSLSDLREAIWVFVEGIGRAIPADRRCDEAIGGQLSRLRESLDSSDTGEIRRAANEAIEEIQSALRERSERSAEQIERLSSRVDEVASQLTEARQQLERDALTEVYNRGAFDEFLERMTHLGTLSGRSAALFLIDIDDFKWVNDHFGHTAGDGVLQEVARMLGNRFVRQGDFVARYGGDEFAAIVQTDNAETDAVLGESCVLRVRDLEIPFDDDQIRVTISMGGARLDPGESPEQWLRRADRALYDAKEAGRDRYAAAATPSKE